MLKINNELLFYIVIIICIILVLLVIAYVIWDLTDKYINRKIYNPMRYGFQTHDTYESLQKCFRDSLEKSKNKEEYLVYSGPVPKNGILWPDGKGGYTDDFDEYKKALSEDD